MTSLHGGKHPSDACGGRKSTAGGRPQVLPAGKAGSTQAPATRPEPPIDVVVPVLNEAGRIGSLVEHLRGLGLASILVVDGGSQDGTEGLAAAAGARVLRCDRGRARQMNAGAVTGEAPVLLFLHADTRLPPNAAVVIRATLRRPGCVGGCFRLRFDAERPLLRLFAWFSRFDTAATTFGDQAFFVRRAAFAAAGGFPDWPLLEDVEFRRRLKGHGIFHKARERVTTSARRFEAEGVLRRQLLNGLILLMHACGVPPARLRRWYPAAPKLPDCNRP